MTISGDHRRAEHRGILLACAINAAVLAGSAHFDAAWSQLAFLLLAPLQLLWLGPIAAGFAILRRGSGYARGIVIGAAISAIVSAGYCCKGKAPAPAPESRPASKPAPPITMLDAAPTAPLTAGR